eukprot:COSAG02_NODE_5126_length_4608_cov_113.503659_1_plen_240_part_00
MVEAKLLERVTFPRIKFPAQYEVVNVHENDTAAVRQAPDMSSAITRTLEAGMEVTVVDEILEGDLFLAHLDDKKVGTGWMIYTADKPLLKRIGEGEKYQVKVKDKKWYQEEEKIGLAKRIADKQSEEESEAEHIVIRDTSAWSAPTSGKIIQKGTRVTVWNPNHQDVLATDASNWDSEELNQVEFTSIWFTTVFLKFVVPLAIIVAFVESPYFLLGAFICALDQTGLVVQRRPSKGKRS